MTHEKCNCDQAKAAEERIQDFEDDFKRVVSEQCAPDEVHCSCVPHLREALKRSEAAMVQLRRERDELGKVAESWKCKYYKIVPKLVTAEGERDEARRERDEMRKIAEKLAEKYCNLCRASADCNDCQVSAGCYALGGVANLIEWAKGEL